MRFQKNISVGVVLALWPLTIFAEPVKKFDPADGTTLVPTTRYDSAFTSYINFQEQQPGNWREHNDEMGKVGGHAGHLKGSGGKTEPRAEPSSPQGMTDHGTHHK